jgi:hypothetical protein
MITCDGAGTSHALIAWLDKLAARPGYQVIYSIGWELGARERAAIALVPEPGRSRSVPAARSASAVVMTPAATWPAVTASAGSKKRMLPS